MLRTRAIMVCALVFFARAAFGESPPLPPAAGDALTITAAELRAAQSALEKIAVSDLAARMDESKKLNELMTADPAKAVLWELWLEGQRVQWANRPAVLDALPRRVRLQAALLGRYQLDLDWAFQWQVENNEEIKDTEAVKNNFMIDMEALGKLRWTFRADGTLKIEGNDPESSDAAAWSFNSDNGKFTAVLPDRETNAKQYLRGFVKDGNVYVKTPVDVKEFCLPFKLKRIDPAPKLALAALLEPLMRGLASAQRKMVPVPLGLTGEYESEDDTMRLVLCADGKMSIEFQNADNTRRKAFASGTATFATDARAEFDCDIDFFAGASDSTASRELDHFSTTFIQKGRQLTQTFNDEMGEQQTVIWIKAK
ncbi:MAG TPA: hypothetical protein VKX17_28310 [Planctomycetota bacterium]|nr:hypothetical protein [Planctomycetota bacterium]